MWLSSGGSARSACVLLISIILGGVACTPTPAPTASPHPAPAAFAFRPLVCDSLPTSRDSVTDTLYMTIAAPVHTRPLPPQYVERVLDALREAFIMPRPVALPVFVSPGRGVATDTGLVVPPPGLRPAVAAEVEFTLGDTGSIVGRVSTASLSPAIDRALADAPRRADSLHLIGPLWGPQNPGGPVKFFVTVLSMRPQVPLWTPLLAVRVPQWRDGRSAQPASDEATATPAATRVQGNVHGEDVVLQVVIDEGGHPILGTLRLVEAHYREFARAAVNRLEGASYRAASIGGCAVKGIAELRYSFPVGG